MTNDVIISMKILANESRRKNLSLSNGEYLDDQTI